MTNIHRISERLAAANNVPSPESLPDGVWSSAALLERVHERRQTVTEPETSPIKQPHQQRGPLIALLSAAAVLLVGAVFAAGWLNGDEGPDAAATSDPQAITANFFAAYEAGDVEGYEALLAADATWYCETCPNEGPFAFWTHRTPAVRDENTRASQYIAATGAKIDATCEESGDAQICRVTITSGLTPGLVTQDNTARMTVVDGLITDVLWDEFDLLPQGDSAGLSAYNAWLRDNHPEQYETLFALGTTLIAATPEIRDLHQQYVAEFLADAER